MSKSVLEVLKGARELLSSPSRWARFASARDHGGIAVSVFNKQACRWCLTGAVMKAAELRAENSLACEINFVQATFAVLQQELPVEFSGVRCDLAAFNDAAFIEHEDVLALIDKAIARASSA